MKAMFERSPDTARLIEALRGVNDEISYRDLAKRSELSERRLKECLASARRYILREDKAIFGVIKGYGIRRLSNSDKVGDGENDLKKIYRASKRSEKKLVTVEYAPLTKEEQHRVTTLRTCNSIIAMNSKVVKRKEHVETAKPDHGQSVQNILAMSGKK